MTNREELLRRDSPAATGLDRDPGDVRKRCLAWFFSLAQAFTPVDREAITYRSFSVTSRLGDREVGVGSQINSLRPLRGDREKSPLPQVRTPCHCPHFRPVGTIEWAIRRSFSIVPTGRTGVG
jgi:hypothetical protein